MNEVIERTGRELMVLLLGLLGETRCSESFLRKCGMRDLETRAYI